MDQALTGTSRLRELPAWVRRLPGSGFGEAMAALVILVFSEIIFVPDDGLSWPQFLTDASLCLAAGASGRWPLAGSIGVGVALTGMVFVYDDLVPWSVFATLIPVIAAGVRGRTLLRDVTALVYLVLMSVITVRLANDTLVAFQSVLIWTVMIGSARAISATIHRLRLERERQAALRVESVRAQRRSIARDLHDTVAYATTTMIMRAEELKLRKADDPELVADLDFIISTGRRSVRDLRGMLEALRRNDPAFDVDKDGSPWRVMRVADVLAARQNELAAHGLALGVQTDVDLDALPESVRETLGKLVVEATSNMVKHAAPGVCRIMIELADDTLEAVFTNPVRPGAPPSTGRGLGLTGATERVEALGGELEATQASGTWILRAQLPVGH